VGTLLAGIAVGLCTALMTPILFWPNQSFAVSKYQYAAPFVIAIVALLSSRRRVVSVPERTCSRWPNRASGPKGQAGPLASRFDETVVRRLVIADY
jgi:hypothetical protein